MVASDFPSGWTSKPASNSSDAATTKVAAKIAACKQYLAFRDSLRSVTRAKSPDFELANSTISNTTSVFRNAKTATAAMTVFGSAKTASCLDQLFSKLVATKDASVQSNIGPVTLDAGDQAIAYAGQVTITAGGQQQVFGLSLIAIRTSRGVGAYTYFSDTDQTAVLQAAIDSSMTRFQTALA